MLLSDYQKEAKVTNAQGGRILLFDHFQRYWVVFGAVPAAERPNPPENNQHRALITGTRPTPIDASVTPMLHDRGDERYGHDLMGAPMTRPFRVVPPDAAGALLRPGLLRRLLQRFESRVVVVRAGAGFGKTTALAQAMAQNHVASRGHDVWLGCESADTDESHLRAGVATALGLTAGADNNAIAAAVAARSPAQVCLLIDDFHEVTAGSTGAEFIERLIAELPSNGHILLATRSHPPLSLARMEVQGRVTWIDETDLALNSAELTTLAERAGRAPDEVAHLGGWPALVALGLRSGPVAAFLDEEVLTSLDHDQHRLLGVVAALGGADAAVLGELTGIDPGPALASLPMVHHVDGWYRAHDLWLEVFSPRYLASTQRELLRPAVEQLLSRGQADRAVELACRGDQDDLTIRALRAAVIGGRVEEPETLRRWLNMIPQEISHHPIARHIEGLLEQSADPTTHRSRDLFEQAADGFATLGDTEAVVSAVAELGFWYHIQRDAGGLMGVASRMAQLAEQGEEAAAPYIDVTAAFVALSQGDPQTMLSAVRRARRVPMTGRFDAIADWLEYQALEFQGHSDVELADRYLEGAGAIRGTEVIAISARWRAGRVEELLTNPNNWTSRSGSERARFLSHAWLAAVTAGCGDTDSARSHLSQARRFAGDREARQVEITLALPEVLIVHEEGDFAHAEQMLLELLEQIPIASDTRLSYNGSGALVARFAPDALGNLVVPLPARDLDLGFALRRIDQTGELEAITTVNWPPTPGLLISSLFLRTSCEFVAAGWAVDRPEARGAAEWLLDVIGDNARSRFRDLADHPIKAVGAAAKEILAAVPLPPADPRRLRLLGTEQLHLGGIESDHEGWRRERVRSLLGYLVIHPETTRDAVMSALWPEATEEAARRNLRSTLNLLLGVLESTRSGGDAAYFVRTDGTRLRLAGHDRLEIDVWRFDSLVDEAQQLESDGAPSLALECLVEATALYRGDLLAGIHEGEWLHIERQRLHVRFVNAAVRCSELLLAHDRVDDAVILAGRTVKVEPWSEPAHRALVAAHLQRGDRAAAHRAMNRCHEVLDELGGPVDELTAMLERRLTGI